MADSTQMAGSDRGHTVAASIVFMAWIRAKASAALKTLRMARMLSVLSKLSDDQLAQIGISRSNIPEYAAKLMADE